MSLRLSTRFCCNILVFLYFVIITVISVHEKLCQWLSTRIQYEFTTQIVVNCTWPNCSHNTIGYDPQLFEISWVFIKLGWTVRCQTKELRVAIITMKANRAMLPGFCCLMLFWQTIEKSDAVVKSCNKTIIW